MASGSNNTWCIFTAEGIKYLNDRDYLNHLLEKIDDVVKTNDKHLIKFLLWDFKELRDSRSLSPLYALTILSQINFLNRILGYTPLKDYKRDAIQTIEENEE